MKKHLLNRILSLVLAFVMVVGMFPAVSAAPAGLRWEKSDLEVSLDKTDRLTEDALLNETAHKPTDLIRVSIVLEDAPTLKAGFATMGIASNSAAMAYDLELQKIQETMEKTISRQALEGKALDVVWNLTLASNIISANVPYGKIDAVKAVPGVKDVVVERQYATEVDQVTPDTYTSAGMVGASNVWNTGFTGAGMRVAIIDTGTDTDHQSFSNAGYLHALEQNARAAGMSLDAYMASLDLLDAAEIGAVLSMLNATERVGASADQYYINEKLPFGANYVDYNLTVDHDSDNQGSHGSHVAGIAAANRYIPAGGSFADARETVRMSGIAPDAQLITLKVFGNAAGPYDSDYFAAIEDAIWLGCDSVNLSLGSGAPGVSTSPMFAKLLEFMATTDTVVVMSAGNSGYWAEQTTPGYLYADGVSFHTSGTPGTYTNSLSVASVDNDGTVGKYLDVAGHMIVYTETEYGNRPISSLDTTGIGTDYEYIFIDGLGKPEDYEGMDLTGKVVFCHRGELSFAEKANNAARLGAAAVVICNNVEEPFGMDLTDYAYSTPCVSIMLSDADTIRAASTRKTSSAGTTYYTGTVNISGKLGAAMYNSEYYTMSSFSSWGIPGSLELKPEITAPGGLIWSVNGVAASGKEYELMSGTSMAAPQVTGMAALVIEYIEKAGLAEKTGMSARHLAQSLLMSTSEPLFEEASGGEYYSILNQGSGLARVDLATTAESYILVNGMDDGKVKVELGDDPARSGTYSFGFTINNISGEAVTYALSADLFTQDVFGDDNGNLYLDTWTSSLPVNADFTDAQGGSLANIDYVCDLNGDGITNAADAEHLLAYLLDNSLQLHGNGDINGDGKVTSYDAHVLLTKQTGSYAIDVPANGSAEVWVTLTLPQDVKAYLDATYPTGAYIESFVYAEPVSDAEGIQGVTHSIPVLGYYGSWTEPSMFDVGSFLDYTYGTENRAPYLYDLVGTQNNFFSISYGDNVEYLFGGNPFVEESEYLPERNAFNNTKGYMLHNLRFSLIRNAADTMMLLEDADTGKIYLAESMGEYEGAYFHVNQGAWQNHQHRMPLGLDLAGIPEGTRLKLSLIAAPEYYSWYDAETETTYTDWEALAEGACLSTTFTIDNTAPELLDVKLNDDNTLTVTAKDNEYIAAVALMNASGSGIITAGAANQTERGATVSTVLDARYAFGSSFLLAVYDYAENSTVYEISLELDNELPYFTAIDRTNANADGSYNYVGMEANGFTIHLAPATGRKTPRVAEYVEGYVFEITDDSRLYVGSNDDLFSFQSLGELDPTGEWQIVYFNDMAYNKADGKLYGLFYSQKNNLAVPFLCTINMFSGEMTVLGQMPIDANSLAIDGNGNFYSTIYAASQLYTYTADVATTGNTKFVGQLGGYKSYTISSMAWDHNTNELYWACTNDTSTTLLKINTANAQPELITTFDFVSAGLFIAYEVENDIFVPVNTVDSITLTGVNATLVNNTTQLTANVHPWNVTNNAVVWSSSNTSVATVDENGLVLGVSQGEAVITATSVLDPSKSASCTVTVSALETELKGVIWDEEGQVWWSKFNTGSLPAYTKLEATANNLPVNATMVANGKLYASTLDTSAGLSKLYTVDPETFEMTKVGPSNIAYLDMSYGPGTGYGYAVYFNYVVLIDLATGDYFGAFDWTEGQTSDLVGITYYTTIYNSNYGVYIDYFLLLDADGNVYLDGFVITDTQAGFFNGPVDGYVKTIGAPVDYSYFQGFHFDGNYVYWTRFSEEENVVTLIAWDCEQTDDTYTLGTFPEGVWPVGGLYTDAEINGTNALVDEELAAASVKTVELMTSVPTAALAEVKGGLNTVTVNAAPAVRPASSGALDPYYGLVQVAVTMPSDATNGVFHVSYDSSKLTYVGMDAAVDAAADICDDNGKLSVAFADKNTIPAGETVVTLMFWADSTKSYDTQVAITTTELNLDTVSLSETVTVNVPHFDCPSENFVDVNEGDWWHEAVDYVVSMGYMNGMDAAHYGPAFTMNRAQFVTVLYRMEGEPKVNNTGIFTDVPAGQFYTDAAYWALEAGITTGATATTFNPGGQLSRTELVTFMYRYAKYCGFDISANADLSRYRDAGEILPFAVDAWKWSVSHGIVSGMTSDTLAPMSLTNRAQAAVIFQRFDNTFLWNPA